jgi:MFS family permease
MERPAPVGWREVFSGSLGRLAFALFLLEVLAAMQILVVATLLPVIAKDLHGLRLYGWAFSASGLATVMTIPLGGRAIDRIGPRKPFVVALGVFVAGTVVAGLAPTMPVFVMARFLQGAGAGAEYAVGLGAVAKAFPEAHRPRVLALLAVAWVLPGLVGPSYGALLAGTIGWRWAFLTMVPLLVASGWLAFRGLGGIHVAAAGEQRVDVVRPLVLAVGTAAALAGLTNVSPWSVPLIAGGVAVALPAGMRLVRGGAGGPGLALGLVAGFLLSLSFFAVDGFVPLLLTSVRGR